MNATNVEAQLKQVEAAIAQNAQAFQSEAPEQFAMMKRVLEAMKKTPAGKPQSDEVKRLVLELVRWQFEVQRAEYDAQRKEALAQAKRSGDPALEKVATAYGELVKMLELAKAAELPPSPKAQAALDDAAKRVKQAFEVATAAVSRSTLDIPMRVMRKPITSSSGVALKAVEPPPRAAAGAATPAPKAAPPKVAGPKPVAATSSPPPPRPSGIRELGSSDARPKPNGKPNGKATPAKKK